GDDAARAQRTRVGRTGRTRARIEARLKLPMAFRSVPLDPPLAGRLWLSSMPGRFESWREFVAEAHRRELALVVCLNPREELTELSPPYYHAIAQGKLPFRWLNLPMQNFGLPADGEGFREGIEQAGTALQRGHAVPM